jgi:hypothetical protein
MNYRSALVQKSPAYGLGIPRGLKSPLLLNVPRVWNLRSGATKPIAKP